jgi:hypothetical protein
MGGKGSASNVMKQDYGSPTATTEGGWEWADKTAQAAPPKKEEAKAPPITEDPSKVGAEAIKQDAETQPYAPPGWGNYPKTGSNLTGLGDASAARQGRSRGAQLRRASVGGTDGWQRRAGSEQPNGAV